VDEIKLNINPSGKIHIEGFPDAIAVVSPTDMLPENAQLRQLALHRHDLIDARHILQLIDEAENISSKLFLWESAVVKVTKCFKGANSRKPLDRKKFLSGKPGALDTLRYFESMRDKTIVHDDNGYNHCDIGLVINGDGKSYSIEKIVTPSFVAIAMGQENSANLSLLIQDSLAWIQGEYDQLAKVITDHYEKMGREALLKYPPMCSDLKVSPEDMHRNRGTSK